MSGGSHFVAMTTPMSLQPWWWQIFILIQLWSQFFQIFVYGDVCLSSHLHIPGGSTLLPYGPHFFTILSEKFGQLARFFWANGLPPPLAKNFPYAYARDSLSCATRSLDLCILFKLIFWYLWHMPPHVWAFHTFCFTPMFRMYITTRNIFLIPDDAVDRRNFGILFLFLISISAVRGLTWTIFYF